MKDDWYVTDDGCSQYCKDLGKGKFAFIQMNWLDTIGNDDTYCVCADKINMNDLSVEEIETDISLYSYTINELIDTYGFYGAIQIAAECWFENHQSDANCISDVVTEKEAEKIIQKYLEEH